MLAYPKFDLPSKTKIALSFIKLLIMQPMPTKNTSFKRHLIREPDEEELEVEIEKQQVVNLSGIQVQKKKNVRFNA
jgi:hypothetical protein